MFPLLWKFGFRQGKLGLCKSLIQNQGRSKWIQALLLTEISSMVYGTLIDPGLIPPVIPTPEGEQHPDSPQTCVSLLFLVPLVPADRDMAAWASPPTQRAPMGSQCCSCSEESANTRYQELVVFTRLVLRRTDFNYERRKESLKICMQAQGWGWLRRKQNLEGSMWRTSKSQADQAVKHGLSPADFDSSLQTRPIRR